LPEIVVNPSKCVACRFCEIACAVNRDASVKNVADAASEEIRPQSRVKVDVQLTGEAFLPVQCRHCEGAPCLEACPAGALYRNEDGVVLLDEAKCVGCWMCVAVCPYGAVKPARAKQVAFKCDRCTGCPYPYCVNACPTGALMYGETEEFDKEIACTESDSEVESLCGKKDHVCEIVRLGLASLEDE